MVSLTPLYADPAKKTSDIDLNLHPSGYSGSQDLLNFRTYKGEIDLSRSPFPLGLGTTESGDYENILTLVDLYLFQEAITGYLAAVDL